MTMKTLLGAAAFSLALAVPAANAATFTVNGQDFDITTVTGTFDSLNSTGLLSNQIWFGDQLLAIDFATAVGFSLGTPNFGGDDGPLFAYGTDGTDSFLGVTFGILFSGPPQPIGNIVSVGSTLTFAVATPLSAVPLPAGGMLMLSGLAGIAAFKRRKKHPA